MSAHDEFGIVAAANRDEWRAWLAAHHDSERGVWLVIHKKASPAPSVTYAEAVEEALCFGWIDSRGRKLDEMRYTLTFTPRKKGGIWAASNKARVARLIAEGRMTPAGLAIIDAAKADGSWDAYARVDAHRDARAAGSPARGEGASG